MEKEAHILDPIELRVYIEYLRIELLEVGDRLGLTHQQTVRCSEELDYFINEYQKLLRL